MTLHETDLPLPSLRALIDQHGTLSVGWAYLRAALARRKHPPDLRAETLSLHIRRDIGLDRTGWE
ncbi:hypothetical protein [Stagnihabitans tardus]|uniref:Uncharacterized protein n=1 Tax=Stagnihabitans tardus TaxID=2699202 RepID=A0AAE4YCF5_9RHOB|nr:hypothetical protein [Stagnihabitans tardus]NBZ88658.1 hypothetical protein [Stagnihabitans tardus]